MQVPQVTDGVAIAPAEDLKQLASDLLELYRQGYIAVEEGFDGEFRFRAVREDRA